MWETLGRNLKKAGKAIGNQAMIDKGRHWQYGHLSPDQLMRQHPSAFLRTFAVQSHLEEPDHVGMAASTQQAFQLRHDLGNRTTFPTTMTQIRGGDGVDRVPRGHLHLIFAADQAGHAETHASGQAGATFQAAFLPMRQVARDNFGKRLRLTDRNIPNWSTGGITDSALGRQHEDVTLTTQLSGCTIAKRKQTLMHLRPAADGRALQSSLPREHTFGRLDYPAGEQAFVMTRRKPDGRTRLYYQRHDTNTGVMHTGKKYL